MSAREILKFYRTAERAERYAPGDRARRAGLAGIYRAYRRFFGPRVLDLACGGGVLGFLVEERGHDYLGVDVNPDMLRAARRAAQALGSTCRFLEGDITRLSVRGRFDTVTLLGNALSHLRADELGQLLARLRSNVLRGTSLIVDYRDTVGMFYRGRWKSPYVEVHKTGSTEHRTRGVDLRTGVIHVRARRPGAWTVDFTQTIWAPFILEALASGYGWELASRRQVARRDGWVDVYRFVGPHGRTGEI